MPLTLHALSDIAARIDQPFSLVSLGLVGDIAAHLYVAQGQLAWHKHIDEDEIFLVHEGALQVETERGDTVLHAEDALLVPKGVGHRSGSALRSIVLLFRQQILSERKNGHRNYLVTGNEPPLTKIRLGALAAGAAAMPPFESQTVAAIEDYQLSVFAARDVGTAETAKNGGTLLYAMRGSVSVELPEGDAHLETGHLAIMSSGAPYKLHCAKPAVIVKFERK